MKIDLVYLWVDDNDKIWQEKKSEYSVNKYNKDAVNNCRFINNDELKYSLRSVEKYAPWVNQIFIITDNQKPQWLNINNNKIRIIDHSEIIPEDKLPLFNSCAIESRIPFIPELSEFFLYANDDTLFWDNVSEDFFFEDEKPICRLDKKISRFRVYTHLYSSTINRAYNIVKEKYSTEIPAYFPHHGIDAYRKSLFLECINEFQKEFDETLNHRFRDYTDMQRMAISYYTLAKGMGISRTAKSDLYNKFIIKTPSDSSCFNVQTSTLKKIQKSNTKLMCINDCRKTTAEDRVKIREILETKFPDKSQYEL